jgi:hypothetical protein
VNSAEDCDDSRKLRKSALLLGALAIVGMGSVTVACSPRTEQPADTSVTTPATDPSGTPTEKNVRTNVTRTPMSAVPPGGGGNPAIPCGFGPAGGGPCTRNN